MSKIMMLMMEIPVEQKVYKVSKSKNLKFFGETMSARLIFGNKWESISGQPWWCYNRFRS